MSEEHIPVASPESTDNSYAIAVQKQQLESAILSRGENFDQTQVDAFLTSTGNTALSQLVETAPLPTAESVINDLTISEEESTGEDIVAEAARRQALDINTIYAKQDLQERAARENWPEDKYQSELSKIEVN